MDFLTPFFSGIETSLVFMALVVLNILTLDASIKYHKPLVLDIV